MSALHIQRWTIKGWPDVDAQPLDAGEFVTYADHVAAVAAARAEVVTVDLDGNYAKGYKMGYAKGLIEGDSGGRKEGFRVGYDTAWSLSAAEIERACEARVREEEQVAQTLARAELYSMEEMDERCEEAIESTLSRVIEILGAIRHEDACCSRGCACQTHENPEPCDLLCNCMVGSIVSEILYAVRRAYGQAIPEPPTPFAKPAYVNRWSGRDAKRG